MARDLHDNVKVVRSISPVAVGTTGTGQTGKIVDRSGFKSVELIIDYGTVTATNATTTVTLKEGAATGTMTSVADTDMIGLEANVSLGAAATRTSGVSKNVTKRLGYVGTKQYVQALIKSTVSAGIIVGAHFVLGGPNTAPVAT